MLYEVITQDFKSVRFMRMFMTSFADPTILRFATLDLVRGEWRKYNASFMQPGEYIVDELAETPFDVSAVNIEENSSKTPVNYILPPDINRQIDPMNPQFVITSYSIHYTKLYEVPKTEKQEEQK